jgi:Zn-dependent protease with chaperone function
MPYTNLIFFTLSLLIYITYLPNDRGDFHSFLFSFLILTGGYYLFTWFTYHHFKRKYEKKPFVVSEIIQLIDVLEKRFIFLALFLYLFLIYNSGLKNMIWKNSLLKESPFLGIVVGLSPFLLFLIISWSNSFKLFKSASDTKLDKKTYLLSQLKLNAPILIPVIFFSLLEDIFKLFSFKGFGPSQMIWFISLLVLLVIFYPLIIKFIWGFYPLPEGPLKKKMEEYCHRSGLKVSNIFICSTFRSRLLTAGIMGIIGKLRFLFISPELLSILNEEEIESVIAHEAGHVKNKHLYYYVLLFFGLPLFFSFGYELFSLGFYGFGDFFTPFILEWDFYSNIISLIVLFLFSAFILLYLRVFFGILSRNFERQADLFVFEVVGHPLNLISSLEKISRYGGYSKDTPNWHHYSIGQRIKFLLDCQKDRHKIEIHQKKVRRIKKSLVSFFVITLLILGVLKLPQIRKSIKLNLMEEQVQRLMAKNPENVDLHLLLANILLEKKKYYQAATIYQKIIQINPNNVTALNNLAWIYATSDDRRVRDKKRALTLAQKAANLRKEPFILDTLAEAYFVNGEKEKALEAIEAAIALQPKNIEYYLKQKQKFISMKDMQSRIENKM